MARGGNMNLCNYNYNISTLISLQESSLHVSRLFFNADDKVYNFYLGGKHDVLNFDTESEGKNFKYISIIIMMDMPGDFAASYRFNNMHNGMSMYFYGKKWWR
jgi:hypothetical protein